MFKTLKIGGMAISYSFCCIGSMFFSFKIYADDLKEMSNVKVVVREILNTTQQFFVINIDVMCVY